MGATDSKPTPAASRALPTAVAAKQAPTCDCESCTWWTSTQRRLAEQGGFEGTAPQLRRWDVNDVCVYLASHGQWRGAAAVRDLVIDGEGVLAITATSGAMPWLDAPSANLLLDLGREAMRSKAAATAELSAGADAGAGAGAGAAAHTHPPTAGVPSPPASTPPAAAPGEPVWPPPASAAFIPWPPVSKLPPAARHLSPAQPVRLYHATTSYVGTYSPVAYRMDWAAQPPPFLRYVGSRHALLPLPPPPPPPLSAPAASLPAQLSAWLHASLAVSAVHVFAGYTKRVVPSSGGLYPVEAYLLGPAALWPGAAAPDDAVVLLHYTAQTHGLELRARLTGDVAAAVLEALPPTGFLLLLSAFPCRETWKYGERGYRYTLLDAGHAFAAVCTAGHAVPGWSVALAPPLPPAVDAAVAAAMSGSPGEVRMLNVVVATGDTVPRATASGAVSDGPARGVDVYGQCLPPTGRTWEAVESVQALYRGPGPCTSRPQPATPPCAPPAAAPPTWSTCGCAAPTPVPRRGLVETVRARRSSSELRPVTLPASVLFCTLQSCGADLAAFAAGVGGGDVARRLLLCVYVTNVQSPCTAGLYAAAPHITDAAAAAAAVASAFGERATPVASAPPELHLHAVAHGGDVRVDKDTCDQSFVARGSFTVCVAATLGDFDVAAYHSLHYAAGVVGNAAYLSATSHGLGCSGLGCFVDGDVATAFGLPPVWSPLYCMVVGGMDPDAVATEPMSFEQRPHPAFDAIAGVVAPTSAPPAPPSSAPQMAATASAPSDGVAARHHELAAWSVDDPATANTPAVPAGVSPCPAASFTVSLADLVAAASPTAAACGALTASLCRYGFAVLDTAGVPAFGQALRRLRWDAAAFFRQPGCVKSALTEEQGTGRQSLGYVRTASNIREYVKVRHDGLAKLPPSVAPAFTAAFHQLRGVAEATLTAVAGLQVPPTRADDLVARGIVPSAAAAASTRPDDGDGAAAPRVPFLMPAQVAAVRDIAPAMSSLSAIHYMPTPPPCASRGIAPHVEVCDTHEDTGLLTFGCVSTVPGLQVQDRVSKRFLQLETLAPPDSVVVMVGKKVPLLSGSERIMPATPHRVHTAAGCERTSFVYLLDIA